MYVVFENDIVVDMHVIPVLYPGDEELVHAIVSQFMSIDEFRHYVDDGEVCQYGICIKGHVTYVGVVHE